jgi:PAS domain S-box-containing protein
LSPDRIALGSYECDVRSGQVSLSASLRQITGFSENRPLTTDEFIGLVHPDDRATVVAATQPTPGATPPAALCRFLRPSGETRWTVLRAEPIRGGAGDLHKVVGLVFDTTWGHDAYKATLAAMCDPAAPPQVFRDAPVALLLCSAERVLDINEAFGRLTGFTREEAVRPAGQDTGLWERFRLAEIAPRIAAEGRFVDQVWRVRAKDQRPHLVLVSAAPMTHGRQKAVLVAFNEAVLRFEPQSLLTERERADVAVRALRDSQEQFRQLAEAHGEGVALQESGTIVHANSKLGSMFGYDPDEMVGEALESFRWPDARDPERHGGESDEPYVFTAERQDGTTFSAEVSPHTVNVDGRVYRVATVRDVTRRERVEQSRRALFAGTAGVAGLDFFRALVSHLAAAFRVKYAMVAEFTGESMSRVTIVSFSSHGVPGEPADRPLSGTACEQVMRRGLQCFSRDVAAQFPADRWLADLGAEAYFGAPLIDSGGRPTGVLAVLHDEPLERTDEREDMLTTFAARASVELQRLRVEQEIRRLNAELEQRVADRTKELEAANRELEAFSYSVSHDLRAPVRHISGFVELLEGDARSVLGPEGREHVSEISSAAARMTVLIDTLLDFSRLVRTELRSDVIDLAAMARTAAGELSKDAAGRAVEWAIDPIPAVRGDRVLLRQVVVNLLSNALKYSRTRPVASIEVGMAPASAPDEVVWFVRDNGVGFDMARAHKLFGVFQRLHPASQFEGTGVGLANVHRIITRHGGRVWAESLVDRGATFFVALPSAGARRAGEA